MRDFLGSKAEMQGEISRTAIFGSVYSAGLKKIK